MSNSSKRGVAAGQKAAYTNQSTERTTIVNESIKRLESKTNFITAQSFDTYGSQV